MYQSTFGYRYINGFRVDIFGWDDIKEQILYEIEGKTYEVTFKIGYVNGEIISSRPEYEDLKRIAEDSGLALKEIKELVK